MPSDRRQLNVRVSPEAGERFDRLLSRLSAELGVELSQAQVVEMALKALEEKYPPPEKKSRK